MLLWIGNSSLDISFLPVTFHLSWLGIWTKSNLSTVFPCHKILASQHWLFLKFMEVNLLLDLWMVMSDYMISVLLRCLYPQPDLTLNELKELLGLASNLVLNQQRSSVHHKQETFSS